LVVLVVVAQLRLVQMLRYHLILHQIKMGLQILVVEEQVLILLLKISLQALEEMVDLVL
tara:strand:+ start:571 stop:747 length:177 start_codon:yes stop_codon:yes gene_type:complete